MLSDAPIGIFDSGIGGLSVLGHIHALLPNEHIIYVSDRAHLPYGDKDNSYILQRSRYITQFLVKKNVKAIVIACNTATAAAVNELRESYSIPIIGMEPGVKPAIQQSLSGMIAVLATQGTLSSYKFKTLLQQHADGSQVIICPCHGWVETIEKNGHRHHSTRELVIPQIESILETGVDTLVLGCTHYPFLKETIAATAGPTVSIIDTGPAVAKQLYRKLAELNLLNKVKSPGTKEFWCSAPAEETQAMITRLLPYPAYVKALPEDG